MKLLWLLHKDQEACIYMSKATGFYFKLELVKSLG